MTDTLPQIYFYIPESDWPPDGIPQSADIHWLSREITNSNHWNSVYCWTLQTYIRLKADGFPCELTGSMPSSGIVLAHRSSLPFNLQPKPRLLIINLKADHDQHPYAQLQIVQNRQEYVRNGYYIPLWPQPELIPRDVARGNRFENVAYFGIEKNLAPELKDKSWQEQLNALGLRWHVVSSSDSWHDYSNVDVVLAVRSFDPKEDYRWKPATKLYNTWHAGVPAILGCDSAFRAERKSELDYLEVASVHDTVLALKRLRDDQELRYAMVENGRVRAEETQPEKLVNQWRNFLIDIAVPTYHRWCKTSSWSQKIYLARCYLVIKENSLKPHPLYPHDTEQADDEQMDIQDWAIRSTIQTYRKVRKLTG